MNLFLEGKHPGGRGKPGDYYVTGGLCLAHVKYYLYLTPDPGVHLTAHSYPVSTYLKQLTCTECSGKANIDHLKKLTKQSIDQSQTGRYLFDHTNIFFTKINA